MVKTRRQVIGKWGETLAGDFLLHQGYQIVGRNIRTSYGEIDLIAICGDEVLFVEVKTRTNLKFGLPEDSINHNKRSHMIQAAEAYIQEHPELGTNWRIDVVAIYGSPKKPNPEIVHFENAIL